MINNVIQMRISLNYIEPEIWRRFIVDSSITLHKLHELIQTVMGWTDSHLYSFTIRKVEYQMPNPEGYDFFDSFDVNQQLINSKKIILHELNLRARQKFEYLYDFGDNWKHTILVEKIFQATDSTMVPYCIEGKRACPPEDCGSIPGYYQILEVLTNATTQEDKELLEWVGDDYNPELFNFRNINIALHPKKVNPIKLKLIQGGGKKP